MAERDSITGTSESRLDDYLKRLIATESHLGRAVWTDAAAGIIGAADTSKRDPLYERAVATLAAAYAIPKRLRQHLISSLAEQVLPIAA